MTKPSWTRLLISSFAFSVLFSVVVASTVHAQTADPRPDSATSDPAAQMVADQNRRDSAGHLEFSSGIGQDTVDGRDVPAPTVSQSHLSSASTTSAVHERKRLLVTLEATFVGLQALDTASTLRALDRGLVEGNPMMRGLTNNPGAFIAVKSGMSVGIVVLGRRLSARHPVAGIVLMSMIDAATSFVVARNIALTASHGH